MNQNAKFIFVVGIGGSDLASKAVWNALTLHKPEVEKKIFFLESPDSREYKEVENFVKNEITNPKEAVLVTISKSGETTETLESFHKTFDILSYSVFRHLFCFSMFLSVGLLSNPLILFLYALITFCSHDCPSSFKALFNLSI